MTKIRKNIYKLMDSFLVEGDKPRPIDRLNRDRHLFVENAVELFRTWADDILESAKDKEFPLGEREWCVKCVNRIVKYQKKKIEEATE